MWRARLVVSVLVTALMCLPTAAALRHTACTRAHHTCAAEAIVTDTCCCDTIKRTPDQNVPLQRPFLLDTGCHIVAVAAPLPLFDTSCLSAAPRGGVAATPDRARNLPLRI